MRPPNTRQRAGRSTIRNSGVAFLLTHVRVADSITPILISLPETQIKEMKLKYNQSLAKIDLIVSDLSKIANVVAKRKHQFGDAVLLDEALWGFMYAKRSIEAILVDIEIREQEADEKAKGNKEKKSKAQGAPSVGNGNVLTKPNNRVGRKTKGL